MQAVILILFLLFSVIAIDTLTYRAFLDLLSRKPVKPSRPADRLEGRRA